MWPSPDTRSPTLKPRTSLPVSTISPEYSWPTAIGTGTVFRAHASQLYICMSVPQIAERCTLMRTSLWPTEGSGTSCIHIPGSARAFTSAFMNFPLVNDAECAARTAECVDHPIELRRGVRGAQLSADTLLSMGDHRERE